MLRLLNAESYRLRKSKSFYTCAIVIAAFVFLMYGMLILADSIQKGKVENGTAGVIVTVNNEKPENSSSSFLSQFTIMDMMQEVFSGDVIACILAIFVSIFVISEYGSGMMKNIVGKGCSRSSIYLSKLLLTILASVIISLIGMAATLFAGQLFIGTHAFTSSFWSNLPLYTVLQLLQISALTSIFVCIGEICRNLAAGISIGIGIAAFPAILLNVIDMQFSDSSITPSQFWPVTRMGNCPYDEFTAGYVTESMLVAAFWLILTTIFGIWHFYKTDIK